VKEILHAFLALKNGRETGQKQEENMDKIQCTAK
jgi:hypothetical protein